MALSNPFACHREHLAEYITSEQRVERLEKLRASVMSSWEGALVWGEGNYLTRVYAPMLAGLVDVAKLAEELAEHPGNERLREDLRRRLKDYFNDLDSAKAAQEMEARWAAEKAEKARVTKVAEDDRLAVIRDNA